MEETSFKLITGDVLPSFHAYKKTPNFDLTLKFDLTSEEEKILKETQEMRKETQEILKETVKERKRMERVLVALVILAASYYVLKKYYSSR